MQKSALILLPLLMLAMLPAARAAPSLGQGSFAIYGRVTRSSFGGLLNGTFRWDVLSLIGQSPVAEIRVLNDQSSQALNFTYYVDVPSRIEIPSFTVASQNPAASQVSSGSDRPTRTFFWIDTGLSVGSVVDTVLGTSFINGTASVRLPFGTLKSCWTLLSQSLGTTNQGGFSNSTVLSWYDKQTGLLVKLDSETSSGPFSRSSDVFLLQSTNINSAFTPGLTLTAVEWASLTMSIIALILGGLAVAVAMDWRQFRKKKPAYA